MSVGWKTISAAVILSIANLVTSAPPVHAQSQRITTSHRVALRIVEASAVAFDDSNPVDLQLRKTSPAAGTAAGSAGSAEALRTLRYTTINAEGTTREITVQWAGRGSPPSGVSLKIAAARVPRECGVASPEVTVGPRPQALISSIPSCTTGSAGPSAVLRYRLTGDDSILATNGRTEVSLVFTISDR